MKAGKIKKAFCGMAVGMVLAGSMGISSQALSFNYIGFVKYNNTELRRFPDYGEVLEVMDKDEILAISKEESSASAYYSKRIKTGTIGYADAHYVEADIDW